MDQALGFETSAEAAAEMEADFARMIAEMKQDREQRQCDQAEIAKSQARSRAMLDNIAQVVAELKALQ